MALLLQALCDPLRQVTPRDRIEFDGDAEAFQCAEPRAFGRHAVQLGQHDQRQSRVVTLAALGNLLQRHRAFLARLAAGHADLDNLFVGKKTERTATGQHLAPVEVRAGGGVYRAFGVALCACCCPQRVGKFLHQQGLIAVQRVEGLDAALEVLRELGRGKLHSVGF